jgi:hypothetical protein
LKDNVSRAAFLFIFLILILLILFLINCSLKGDAARLEIIKDYKLFKKKEEYIKPSDKICNYEGIRAACQQLLIRLYGPLRPEQSKIIIEILKKYDAKVVGQIPDLDVIQIETLSKNIVLLKKELESTKLVEVSYNVESTLNKKSPLRPYVSSLLLPKR